jgi:hypothetical protein
VAENDVPVYVRVFATDPKHKGDQAVRDVTECERLLPGIVGGIG